MNQDKIVYDKVDVSIAVGNPSFSEAKSLRKGTCLGVKFIDFSGSAAIRDHVINVSIETSDSSAIFGKTDYRDFIHDGGSYKESFKPCSFDTNAQINVQFLASEVLKGAALKGQLIFAIKETC